jgi:EpsI family protein
MQALAGKHYYIALGVLIVGIVLIYNVPHGESMPIQKSLTPFEDRIGTWVGDPPRTLDPKTLEVLRLNNYVDRVYRNSAGEWISLYVGYFADQQTGQTIHSPKNCLPGSGWDFLDSQEVTLPIAAGQYPAIQLKALRGTLVNKEERMLAYYWFQSRGRFLASEYWERFYLVTDAIRYQRTDGALVRVLAPLPKGADVIKIDAAVKAFIQEFTPILQYQYFPAPAIKG